MQTSGGVSMKTASSAFTRSIASRTRFSVFASEMTKDVQKAVLELVHDPTVFVVPVTKDDLLAGQGEVFDRLVEKWGGKAGLLRKFALCIPKEMC